MRKSKLIKKVDNQIYFRLFLALLWSKEILLNYCRGFLLKLPILSNLSEYFIPTVLIVMFLMCYHIIAERIKGADLSFVMVCILVYVANFLLLRRNEYFFRREWANFIMGALPFYFVGVVLKMDDEDAVLKLLERISSLSIVAFCIYILFVNGMDESTTRDGDMNSAYNLLPHACLVFYYMIKEFKWYRFIVFLLSLLALLMMGTRGAVLCFLVFIVLCSAVTIRFKRPVVLLVMVLICLLFIFVKGLMDWLMETAYSIGEELGLSTRVFDKLMSGNFAVSDARVRLKERVRQYLLAYPLIGLGIYGDRYVTGGQYVHNLFLEIYGQFGMLIGTVLMVSLTVLFYRGIRYAFKSGEQSVKLIVLLLISCCFKLLVSSSYLREPFFWLLLGYFVALVRESRKTLESKGPTMQKSRFIK